MNYLANTKKTLSLAAVILLLSAPAHALDLTGAKDSGLIGESHDGYLAPVVASAEVNRLVAEINSKRKAHYNKIASKNGISLEAVEVRAGQKAIEKSDSGAYINRGDGWEKK